MKKPSISSVISWLNLYLRYVNYLGAAQLYLKDNCLLERELKTEHIKNRILGHWGTVPGLNFIYAHLNYLISKHHCEILYIAGPGHGAPAVIANLFAENTLAEFYPDLKRTKKGTSQLIKMFSWPGGFPSHTNPGTPGTILEGGELGYSLSTAYGAVLDHPDLIVACVIGDGEAETGPLAASWHSNKYLNPQESGAVLPILHVNGYKISCPTIYGTMSDAELRHLFTGFGYDVKIVNDTHPDEHNHKAMITTLEWAYQKIKNIQTQARKYNKVIKPIWPMIIYRSLKGASGIKRADHHKIEGSFHSHGIPLTDPKTNPRHFKLISNWLTSYKFTELLDKKTGAPLPEILQFVPNGQLRMGMNKYAIGGHVRQTLKLPNITKNAVSISKPGKAEASPTEVGANYLAELIKDPHNHKIFRFMCPDETESNKFQALFKVTNRAYVWPVQAYDEHIGPAGRVMEILSEHTLQGWLQGYILTGRHGLLATYEAFAMIVASMVDQYAKFIKYSQHVPFRKPVSSLNYLLTSVGWRQEHNGYSHQNPGFISSVLEKHGKFCSVYLPPDANSLLVTFEDCLKRTDSINVIVVNKQKMPQWLTLTQARQQLKTGIGIWSFVSPKGTKNPDIVLAAAGDVMVQESMAAATILHCYMPELKVRFVNVSELTALGVGDEKHPLSCRHCPDFDHYFTKDKPVIFTFHGYPGVIQKLIAGHGAGHRFTIHGYLEEGTTTTPFDMMVLNKSSRFHLSLEAIQKGLEQKVLPVTKAKQMIKRLEAKIKKHQTYIKKHGRDMDDIENWKFDDLQACRI